MLLQQLIKAAKQLQFIAQLYPSLFIIGCLFFFISFDILCHVLLLGSLIGLALLEALFVTLCCPSMSSSYQSEILYLINVDPEETTSWRAFVGRATVQTHSSTGSIDEATVSTRQSIHSEDKKIYFHFSLMEDNLNFQAQFKKFLQQHFNIVELKTGEVPDLVVYWLPDSTRPFKDGCPKLTKHPNAPHLYLTNSTPGTVNFEGNVCFYKLVEGTYQFDLREMI